MAKGLPLNAREIGERCGALLIGDPAAVVDSLVPISEIGARTLTFLGDRKWLRGSKAWKDAVILTRADLVDLSLGATFLVVAEPRTAFLKLLAEFNPRRPVLGRISPDSKIDPKAQVDAGVCVGAGAQVGAHSTIRSGTVIHSNVYIGSEVSIGNDCEIFPSVVILDRVIIGDRVKVLPATIIGSEGFGYLRDGEKYVEVPQVGSVVIGDDVRIGANCAIDRATMGATRIGGGTKIDNLVHIAHNCVIGANCIICAQVGLAGSVVLEDGVVLGGQVGLGDHVVVGKGARMGGQSGSSTNIKGNETYFLTPALPIKQVYRVTKALRRLPSLFEKLKQFDWEPKDCER